MSTISTIASGRFADFEQRNPHFDLFADDLVDPSRRDAFDWTGYDREAARTELMTYQRLLRLDPDPATAEHLIAAGLVSAHHIAQRSERMFVQQYRDALGFGDADLSRLHRRAVATKTRTRMLWAAFHGTVGSPHYMAGRMSNVDDDVADYLFALPDYADFFGSLDYCSCEHCASIFGPAAYLVDMLRIVDEYITSSNDDIPPGCKLFERRPDIDKIPLTCAMTNDVVPFLQIVNEVLAAAINRQQPSADVFRTLAAAPYPFNLPFNLPLVQVRAYLQKLGSALWQVYRAFLSVPGADPDAHLPTRFALSCEVLSLSPTQYQVISTPLTTAQELGAQYGVPNGRILTTMSDGTVTVDAKGNTVTGHGTEFRTEVFQGDSVQVAAQRRVVKDVLNKGRLTIEGTWDETVIKATMTVYPRDDLSWTVNFNYRTGLDFAQVTALFVQDLDAKELAAGLADRFFINGSNTAGQYLRTAVDRSDLAQPINRIEHLSLPALDRLNRFIRLSQISGIAFNDLDRALQALGGIIDAKAVEGLGEIKMLQSRFRISVAETIALFADIPTTGVRDPANPADLFDRLFNSPGFLGVKPGTLPPFRAKGTVEIAARGATVTGTASDVQHQIFPPMRIAIDGELRIVAGVDPTAQSLTVTQPFAKPARDVDMIVFPSDNFSEDALAVYHPTYTGNPLYTDPVLKWTVDSQVDSRPETRGRLVSGLGVSHDDLALIGDRALRALGIGDGVIPLTVPNMSLLYRYAKMAALTGLPVASFLKLLDLKGLAKLGSLADVFAVADDAAWLKRSGMNPFALEYAIEGACSKQFDPGLSEHKIAALLSTTWALAANWLVRSTTFVNEDITPEMSAGYLRELQDAANAFVNAFGVVLQQAPDFTAVAFIDPLHQDSFVTAQISLPESVQAFDDLTRNKVLLAGGVLSGTFGRDTDLGFLFPGRPNREAKIAEVRGVLLLVRRRIDYVVETLLTYGGAPTQTYPTRGAQQGNLCEQIGLFLNASTGRVLALAQFIADAVGPRDYVAAFLRPPPAPGSESAMPWPPQDIVVYLRTLNRALVLAGLLELTPTEITGIIANPAPYAVANFQSLALAEVQSLWRFKTLTKDFRDVNGQLVEYFAMQATGDCAEDPKFKLLAAITGWSQSQICALVGAFFETGACYNTVDGIARMKAAFDLGAGIGADVSVLLRLAALNAIGATITDDGWAAYNTASAATLALFKAKYDDAAWPAAERPVRDTLNQVTRDVLAGYAIALLQPAFPNVVSNDDLYNYLLIDVEMTGCADISYIAQAILSVQLYMQRARLMLEPGITEVPVPGSWWSWLTSYRNWEANRKIFLYPENYVEPELRRDKTPLFAKMQDGLSANEITPQTVGDLYVEYFDGFSGLAALRQVAAFYGPAPDPNGSGRIVSTLFVIGRTPVEPYTYYLQRLVDSGGWTAWEKIDVTIGAASVSPVFAFGRLFLFWVEHNTTGASQLSSGTSENAQTTRAALKYSFINYAGRWTPPQTLTELVADFDPMQGGYKTNEVDPGTFDMSSIEWRKVSPLLLNGGNMARDRVLIDFGRFYKLPYNKQNRPVKPEHRKIPNPEAFDLAMAVYDSSDRAVLAAAQGISGFTFVNASILLDSSLNVSPTWVVMKGYTQSVMRPYVPLMPRVVLPKGDNPTLSMVEIENLFTMDYIGQGAPAFIAPPLPPIRLLYNISDRVGTTVPVTNQPFWYVFGNGDESFLVRSMQAGLKLMSDITTVNTDLSGQTNETDLIPELYSSVPTRFSTIHWSFQRLTTGAAPRMNLALFAGGVPTLLSVETQVTPAVPFYPFSRFYLSPPGGKPSNTVPPTIPDGDTIDYDGPYGTYFWEIFFYTPWMVANQLKSNQRFSDAQTWLQYIFDPTIAANADPTAKTPLDRFWRFVHFRGYNMDTLLDDLSNPAQLKAYNDDPFNPNAIARLRRSAYQKAIVLRYVDNLLEWGDYEFTKDTWESINVATLHYTLARDLLGPKPVDVGPCSAQPPMTFRDIVARYGDKIPQFLIGLENALPYVDGGPAADQPDRYVPYNDIDSYFCVPDNADLIAYWDHVDDRLFKIRNCMNIQGVVRSLALFAPPLDVYALAGAVGGAAGPQVVQQWQAATPPYRFKSVIALAKDFTSQLMQIGGQLLAALEKRDAEDLARLRAGQESRILNMTTRVRQLQIDQINQNLAGLAISRESAVARSTFYQNLLDTGLSPSEILNIAATVASGMSMTAASVVRAAAAITHLIPNVGSPFAMTYGGREIGASLDSFASIYDAVTAILQTTATVSLTVAGYERREEDWELQLTQANYDIQTIDNQIAAERLQLQSAQQELAIHQQSIEQAVAIENFLTGKFTSLELYQWMTARLSGVYFQAYRLALEVAMSAELAYQYELTTTDRFISFEYWDGLRKGMLAGEQLMLSLNQMQKAYADRDVRGLELEKTISLIALDPKAVLDLQTDEVCEFSFDEALFDFDFAGHYARQIKTVSVTIPALVGPYQNIHATLIQLGSRTLIKPDLNAVAFLLGETSDTPDLGVLRVNWRANQAIALSSGVDDDGLFELSFSDERYLPFEGTGAVSRWRLDMPKASNLIDYSTISDIVIRLRYTATDGGAPFAGEVRKLLKKIPYMGRRAFNLALEFPSQWFSFLNPGMGAQQQQFIITMMRKFFPANLGIKDVVEIYAGMQLAAGRSLDGKLTATLQIGSGPGATTETLIFDNRTSTILTGLSVANWVDQPWTLTVAKSGVPDGIRDPTTGLIDPSALLTIETIVTYEASRG